MMGYPEINRVLPRISQLLHLQGVALGRTAPGSAQREELRRDVEETFALVKWPNEIMFATIIQAYGRIGDVDAALEKYGWLVESKLRPTVQTFSGIANAFVKSGRYRECSRVLQMMEVEDVRPNEVIGSIIIRGAIAARDFDHAWALYHALNHRGMKADQVLFNDLIVLCKRTNQPARALTVMDEMRENGMVVPVETYNSMVSALAVAATPEKHYTLRPVAREDNYFDQSFLHVAALRGEGHEADSYTYTGLMTACSRVGDTNTSMKLFQAALAEGKAVPLHASVLLNVLAEKIKLSPPDWAKKICEEADHFFNVVVPETFPDRAMSRSASMINSYLKVMAAGRLGHRVYEIFPKMYEDNGVKPDYYTYRALLTFHRNRKRFPESRRVLELARASGDIPPVSIASLALTVIETATAPRVYESVNPDVVLEILNELGHTNLHGATRFNVALRRWPDHQGIQAFLAKAVEHERHKARYDPETEALRRLPVTRHIPSTHKREILDPEEKAKAGSLWEGKIADERK
jgi:pentatricopeptide repeat protein